MQLFAITGTGAVAVPVSSDRIGEVWFQVVSGTNTIVAEASFDGGTTFSPIGIRKAIDDTIVASVAVAGLYYFKTGSKKVQLRCSVFAGAASVYITNANSFIS